MACAGQTPTGVTEPADPAPGGWEVTEVLFRLCQSPQRNKKRHQLGAGQQRGEEAEWPLSGIDCPSRADGRREARRSSSRTGGTGQLGPGAQPPPGAQPRGEKRGRQRAQGPANDPPGGPRCNTQLVTDSWELTPHDMSRRHSLGHRKRHVTPTITFVCTSVSNT